MPQTSLLVGNTVTFVESEVFSISDDGSTERLGTYWSIIEFTGNSEFARPMKVTYEKTTPPPQEPEPEPQLEFVELVGVYKMGYEAPLVVCEKISDVHDFLRPPYDNFPLSGIQAIRNGYCIRLYEGDMLHVSKRKWNVHVNPIAEVWPSWYPPLVMVKTEDGKEWWVRADELREYVR